VEQERLNIDSRDPVLIVGAGLAGLSAAYHLDGRPYVLIEAESSAGGLCRSVRAGGFTFDFTGHLLHIKRPEIRDLVHRLVGDEALLRIDRRSGVYSQGTFTDYPFQVNTHGLPKAVIRECLMGFADTLQAPADLGEAPSFQRWALATFGQGICKHFMIPYNRKLFCTDLESMTADWVSWSIPKPTWGDVVRGAQGTTAKAFGYNPSFFYPAAGGIDHLPNAFAPHVNSLRLSTRVVRIRAAAREAEFSSGEVMRYSSMISTMPLPKLLEQIEDLPRELAEGGRRLRYVSVLNLNLGFDSPSPSPYHWVYLPEPQFPFYRVGVYSNLCAASVPPGNSAFYVEISHLPGRKIDLQGLVEPVVESLRQIGLISRTATLRETAAFDIPYAYVIHDRDRSALLPQALSYLERQRIHSVGRYGAWEYSAMEDALWQGRQAAERART
jgi:protoporphyrinogen oxidase